MRRRVYSFVLVFVLGMVAFSLSAQPLQRPTRQVFDTAGVLAPESIEKLEARLDRLRKSGLAEAIIYLAPALPDGAVMEELTLKAVNDWGIGDAATDNGVALFAFMRDRKLRIEVGLGLESRISDAAAQAILDERVTPAFRAGKHAEGLSSAIDAIEALLQQRPAELLTTRLGKTRRIRGKANAPRVVRRINPRFPDEARRAGTEGAVEMEVLIDSSGKVANVKVMKGVPNGLTEAATEAVRQWLYEPVVADGVAVPALIDVCITFRQ